MDPHPVTISDTQSINSNKRLHEVLQLALDLNIEAEAILSSTDSERSEPELEVECVGEIRVTSKDSAIPRHSDRSLDSGMNSGGVSVARLTRKSKKRRAVLCLEVQPLK